MMPSSSYTRVYQSLRMIDEEEMQERLKKNTSDLFKGFLVILEDLQEEHRAAFSKILDNLPPEYHPMLYIGNIIDDRKMQWLRKRVLDLGNESIRENEKIFIHFKFKQN